MTPQERLAMIVSAAPPPPEWMFYGLKIIEEPPYFELHWTHESGATGSVVPQTLEDIPF